jgi:hypothetical protein
MLTGTSGKSRSRKPRRLIEKMSKHTWTVTGSCIVCMQVEAVSKKQALREAQKKWDKDASCYDVDWDGPELEKNSILARLNDKPGE